MERTELITHLEHLAEYVKYSEDAPALREAIALLKTHEERTETHACDLIQPDHNAEVSKKVGDDLIRRHGVSAWLYNLGYPKLADIVMNEQRFPPAQPEWNNHTVACLLAELFNDTCACNYNDIDEWLPEKCEVIDACPNPVGVACWEQYLTHRAERITDELGDS